ncbi:MAG: type II toxin-antitoxin system Phd/YefM family antitoxin [Candidatus Electronema sp. V4]|uniref:type II toxin-antitoxin system Phd/YefM family antitoxin n=1 Tax=Candidatus Electronema sp. V4 TaxID=3454756 RepID=UPI004055514B
MGRGEEVLITRKGRLCAKLVPVADSSGRPRQTGRRAVRHLERPCLVGKGGGLCQNSEKRSI